MSPIRKAKVRPKTAAPVQKAVAKKAAVAGDGGRKAQPALRVADDLRAVLDSIGDMVLITDPRLAVADANEAAVVALGYDSREEMAGMSAAALVADRDRSRITIYMGRALAEEHGDGTLDCSLVDRDGREMVAEANVQALHDGAGEVTGLIVTARDVTEARRRQAILLQAEEKMRSTVASIGDGVTMIDTFGNITDINEAGVRMLGHGSKEALIGRPFIDSIEGRDQGDVAQEMAQAVSEGRAMRTLNYTLVTADGREVEVEASSAALYDSRGDLTGFVNVSRDVTQRMRMQEELEESSEKLRTVIESIGDMLFITDQELSLLNVNQVAARMLGYDDREQLTGTSLIDAIAEKDRNRFAVDMGRALTSKFIKDIQEYTMVTTIGGEFDVEANTEVLLDLAGMPAGLVITARDVTERKLMQEALRLSEEKLRAMFESMHDGIVLTDVSGTIIGVNEAAARMHGYSDKDDMIGRPGVELVAESDRDRVMQASIKQFKGENPSEISETHTLVRADGTEFESESSRSVLRDSDGRVVGFIAAERDVTERKRMQEKLQKALEELKRSNTELQQFAYVASHDLQEPLRMVTSYLTLLARRYKGKLEQDADEFIEYAVDGAERMQGLIEALLLYSRVNTRGRPPEPTDCEEVLKQTLNNLQVAVEEKGAAVTHDPLPGITADGIQMVQLFQNLIGNAIKFQEEGRQPQVHISAEDAGDDWLFSFRDNGIGIDPQSSERIFTIFQRLHARGTYPGTGIGLSVCKRIVERHGGRIWVESEPGKGATFKFTLPKTPPVREQEPAPAVGEAPPAS